MSSFYNVVVIGYGLSAKIFHIPLILSVPALKLYGVVQRHPKPDDDSEKDHAGIRSWRSAEEMLRDPEVDVVVVSTIPDTHVEFTRGALEAGKHVVVEKPFAPTATEADELIALAKKHSRLLTVYHNRRWDADFLTLQNLLQTPALGRIAEFETHFDRHRPNNPSTASWKYKPLPGSGAVYDLGSHLIDQAVVLFGMPTRITGFTGSQRTGGDGGVEDSCTILLHWANGALGTVKAGIVSLEVEQLRFWVRGEKGTFKKFHLDVQEGQLRAGKRPGDPDFAIEPTSHHGALTTLSSTDNTPTRQTYPTAAPTSYVEFYRIFARALAGEGDVPVKPEEARDVIRLIELARESSRVGRTLDV
ncbi:MAG: hypothetical protein M1839_000335 [Geoglossum umbratile]|nr:MAG: hypothetical protein M1839_000335 [Geoglossum umbratile]